MKNTETKGGDLILEELPFVLEIQELRTTYHIRVIYEKTYLGHLFYEGTETGNTLFVDLEGPARRNSEMFSV